MKEPLGHQSSTGGKQDWNSYSVANRDHFSWKMKSLSKNWATNPEVEPRRNQQTRGTHPGSRMETIKKNSTVFLHIQYFTSDTSGHQMCRGFPHTKHFCNTSWVSYNLTQFWHYLPRDRVRSHRLRAQSYKTAPHHHFRCQSQVRVVTCTSE